MSDRTVRFAARIIAIGLLGVAWTIGTLALVMVRIQAQLSPKAMDRTELLAYLGLAPVAIMLLYVVVTDLHDWRASRRESTAASSAAEQDE